jgi:hypothetical protein
MASEASVERFIAEGLVVLPSLAGSEAVAALRAVAKQARVKHQIYLTGGELLPFQPDLVLPILGSARVLDIAESVIGPFVQLDSISLVGIPPRISAGISWHRDIYGSVPRGSDFQRPLALNLLIYLQDLNEEVGAFRFIPGSHRQAVLLDTQQKVRPHPSEKLLFANAGDGVLLHNNLVHSRSPNLSDDDRIHLSVVYTWTCMRPGINLTLPGVRSIIEELRKADIPRYLRLFGEDASADQRYNSGFLEPDERMWETWRKSEK